jgi:hypothetical protein
MDVFSFSRLANLLTNGIPTSSSPLWRGLAPSRNALVVITATMALASAGRADLACTSETSGPGYPVSGYRVLASVEVNPYCEQDATNSTPGSTVSASLSYLTLTSSTSATGFQLTSAGSMSGGALGELAGGGTFAEQSFSVSGNPGNVALPLMFNFVYSGNYSVTPGIGVQLTGPDVTLNEETDLGLAPTESGSFDLISEAGGPGSIEFAKGIFATDPVSIFLNGVVTEANFSRIISISEPVLQSGSLSLELIDSAEAPGSGTAQYDPDVSGLFVTVPQDYTGVDISKLSVNFADGSTLPVTYATTPEPGAAWLVGLCLGSLFCIRRIKAHNS